MDTVHSSKIPIRAKGIELLEELPSDEGDLEGYDLFMGIWELSASLGNFNHNVEETVQNILHRLNGTSDVEGRCSDSLNSICLGSKTSQNTDSVIKKVSYPAKAVVSEESVEKTKLGSSRLEGYILIENWPITIMCFSKGIRIQSEVFQIVSRKIIPEPADIVIEQYTSGKALETYTFNASEEIPLPDLSSLSGADYNAYDESVSINCEANINLQNFISSPKDNLTSQCFDKEAISENKEVKDVLSQNFPKNDSSSSNILVKDVISDGLKSKDICRLIIEKAASPSPEDMETFIAKQDYFDKDAISKGKEVNDFKVLNIPENNPFSTNCLDNVVISDEMESKDVCSLIIDEAELPNAVKNTTFGSHCSLKKMTNFYKYYKNKLDSITDSTIELCEDIDDNGAALRSEDVGFTDGSLNQLRKSVSDIKLNVLKEVDRSLQLTLQNGISGYSSRKPSMENVEHASTNFGKNSTFTEELRLQRPRKISSKLIEGHQKKKDRKFLSSRLSPTKKNNCCFHETSERKHSAECRKSKERNSKEVVIGDRKKTVVSNCYEIKDPESDSCMLYSDIREECFMVMEDWFFKPEEMSYEFIAEEDDQEILSQKSSKIAKIDKSMTEFSNKSSCREDCINNPEDFKSSSHNLYIDIYDKCHLLKNDDGRSIPLEKSLEKFCEFSAEGDSQEKLPVKSIKSPKDLISFSPNLRIDISAECCDLIGYNLTSQISVEAGGQKKPSTKSSQITKMNSNLTKFSNKDFRTETCIKNTNCKTEACINNPSDLKPPSQNLLIDISDECYLVDNDLSINLAPEKSNAFNSEQDDPILKKNFQADSYVKQPTFNEEDWSLTQLPGKNYACKGRFKDDLKTSSNMIGTDMSLEYLDLNFKIDQNEFLDEKDNQEMLSPILSKIKKTVSDVKLNVLREVDKSISELTLKSVSGLLRRKQNRENCKNGLKSENFNETSSNLSLPENSNMIFDLAEECDFAKNLRREVHTSLSDSTVRSTSDASPKDRCVAEFQNVSLNSEFSLKFEEKNSIIDLCNKCDIKVNYSNTLDKYIAEGLSIQKRNPSEMAKNNGSGDVFSVKSEIQNCEEIYFKWQHQRHIIAAPRAIIKIFKSNSAYECSPEDPNAPDFYEQLDQFFEITGDKKCCPSSDIDVSLIESRMKQILKHARKSVPKRISYSDWVALVGQLNLRQLLTGEERNAYESLRWHFRDTGDEDISAKSRFTDALHGMMGYGSPHLKVSSVTGRLQLRSPQHQDSLSESYLLLSIGHLGYFYRELEEHLKILGQREETAAALRKCLQSYLLDFKLFYKKQKKNPCSLISLYRKTRHHQLHFQWLISVLQNIQNEKSIIVSLYEQSCRRCGYQKSLLLTWLKVASQPMITKLQQWLLTGRLNSLDGDEFLIERDSTSNTSDFWQKRFRITDYFSGFFDPQLDELIISVGKTMVYAQKYLGFEVETCMKSKELREILLQKFDQCYHYADQEPLHTFLRNLHLEVSGKVLRYLRKTEYNPKYLFNQLYKYIMLADLKFIRDFISKFDEFLERPESSFDIQLLNEMKDKILRKPIQDIYIDRAISEGTRCWSCLVLRWSFPKYWLALLGQDAELYEPIFIAIWRFHYVDYVLLERILQQQAHLGSRYDIKDFEGLEETRCSFAKLINNCLELMKVLRHYFFKDLLEPAFDRLLLACNKANTLEDILLANRTYLKFIKRGCLQTKSLRKSKEYLERLYNLVLNLNNKLKKFLKSCETSKQYVLNIRLHNSHSLASSSYRDRMRTFSLTCKNYSYVINDLRDQFISGMISFLLSLHLANEESLRLLALSLDPKGYYKRKDKRLSQVQLFEYMRKTRNSS
ncbi:uncharacterized protein LOC108032769 isoform X3 [Drosophila biarmipes]|uniref:uncharacterized protein LOC108032769 isoform X3 n=1 Tax=Drosophila biarmipes TaxID=125945 RepID=UPI0021CC74A0|nr:uncharacterized protein LOC108032769 isoform X3 [Drosophila biarmipes]